MTLNKIGYVDVIQHTLNRLRQHLNDPSNSNHVKREITSDGYLIECNLFNLLEDQLDWLNNDKGDLDILRKYSLDNFLQSINSDAMDVLNIIIIDQSVNRFVHCDAVTLRIADCLTKLFISDEEAVIRKISQQESNLHISWVGYGYPMSHEGASYIQHYFDTDNLQELIDYFQRDVPHRFLKHLNQKDVICREIHTLLKCTESTLTIKILDHPDPEVESVICFCLSIPHQPETENIRTDHSSRYLWLDQALDRDCHLWLLNLVDFPLRITKSIDLLSQTVLEKGYSKSHYVSFRDTNGYSLSLLNHFARDSLIIQADFRLACQLAGTPSYTHLTLTACEEKIINFRKNTAYQYPSLPKRRLNILYVEDNPTHSKVIKRLLSHVADVHVCEGMVSTKQFLSQRKNLDFILVDIGLPDGCGLEIIKYKTAHYREVPCAIYSAHVNPRFDFRKAGFIDFIVKGDIHSTINRILHNLSLVA